MRRLHCLPRTTTVPIKKKPRTGDERRGFFRFLLGNGDGGGIHHEGARIARSFDNHKSSFLIVAISQAYRVKRRECA